MKRLAILFILGGCIAAPLPPHLRAWDDPGWRDLSAPRVHHGFCAGTIFTD